MKNLLNRVMKFSKNNNNINIKPSLNTEINNNLLTICHGVLNGESLDFNLKDSRSFDLMNTILFLGWGFHEYFLMTNYSIHDNALFVSIIHIMISIWQYVGLFIISHDLHHAEYPCLYENILGRLSLFCYGGFMLEDFSQKHFKHHESPGIVEKDPDFYDGNIVLWYLNFLKNYVNIKQVIAQLLIYNLSNSLGISDEKMILFWLMPSLLASVQLFYYGTYLVHDKDGVIKNSNLPDWLITATSYNFGYHQEHHKYPKVPWNKLRRDMSDK